MKTISFIILFLLTTTKLFASEILLSKISTDFVNKTYLLKLVTNSKNEIEAIKTISNKNKVKNYPVSVLNKPITLVKAAGISLVSLKCQNFHPIAGCDIEIEYPDNIAIGSFKKFQARLLPIRGQWKLIARNKVFKHMKLMARKLAGLLVGVKSIHLE